MHKRRRASKQEPKDHASEPSEQPTSGGGGNPLQEKVRSEAKELCSIFSAAQIAKEYGANPNDLSSVVKAFAAGYQSGVQVSAESGCLEGLTE